MLITVLLIKKLVYWKEKKMLHLAWTYDLLFIKREKLWLMIAAFINLFHQYSLESIFTKNLNNLYSILCWSWIFWLSQASCTIKLQVFHFYNKEGFKTILEYVEMDIRWSWNYVIMEKDGDVIAVLAGVTGN